LGLVSGTIRDHRGKVVTGADVFLVVDSTQILGRRKSDATGSFTFGELRQRSYGLHIEHKGFYPRFYWQINAWLGMEMIYTLHIERCVTRDCDPSKRPKPTFLTICQ